MAFRHFVAAGVIGIAASTAARADSITYANFLSTAGLTFIGSSQQVNSNQLELTTLTTATAGAAYASNKFALGAGGSFTTSFQFSIDPGNTGSGLNANGFTFVLAGSASGLGAGNANLGLPVAANSLAIEFRTYDSPGTGPNGNSGNLVGVVSGGNENYTSLLGSGVPYGQQNCGTTPSKTQYKTAGCLSNGDIWTANIRYQAGLLTVTVQDGSSAVYTVVNGISLGVGGLLGILGTNSVYAGFTASTGGSDERVRLLDWSMYSQVPEPVSIAMFGVGLAALGMVRGRRSVG
jgi:hypothetical protein